MKAAPMILLFAILYTSNPPVLTLRKQQIASARRAAEIADARELPIKADGAEEGCAGDLVVSDVIDFQPAGIDVAQQHIASAGRAAEIANARVLPILAGRQGTVGGAQDHGGRGAGRRRRVGRNGEKEAMAASGVLVRPNYFAAGIDAECLVHRHSA